MAPAGLNVNTRQGCLEMQADTNCAADAQGFAHLLLGAHHVAVDVVANIKHLQDDTITSLHIKLD